MADGKFFILNDDGTLHITKPSIEGYLPLDQAVIIENGHDAWAPFAIANGYLIMRDAETVVCIDLNA
jgi:outer membrane protein assembly factor BamB